MLHPVFVAFLTPSVINFRTRRVDRHYCSFQVATFQRAENMRGDADQVADVHNRRASIFSLINPSKMITAVSGSMHRMP